MYMHWVGIKPVPLNLPAHSNSDLLKRAIRFGVARNVDDEDEVRARRGSVLFQVSHPQVQPVQPVQPMPAKEKPAQLLAGDNPQDSGQDSAQASIVRLPAVPQLRLSTTGLGLHKHTTLP